jgi:hypothetical protein
MWQGCWSYTTVLSTIKQLDQQQCLIVDIADCMIADSTVAWSKSLSPDQQPCCMIKSIVISSTALLHDQQLCRMTDSTIGWSKALFHYWQCCPCLKLMSRDRQLCSLIDSAIAWLSTALMPHKWQRRHIHVNTVTWLLTALLHDWQCCYLNDSDVNWLTVLSYDWHCCCMIQCCCVIVHSTVVWMTALSHDPHHLCMDIMSSWLCVFCLVWKGWSAAKDESGINHMCPTTLSSRCPL